MGKRTSQDILKKNMLEALEKSLGIVSTAAKEVGIVRNTFYEWYKADEEFKRDVDLIGENAIDFVESQLFKQIREGNPACTIFYLKTKGKKRGYVERTEIATTTNDTIIYLPEDNQNG